MYLMKCGHVANGRDSRGNPCCVICVGVRPEAAIIDRECASTEGLEGRTAHCIYHCGQTAASKWELPFFRHKAGSEQDEYYCGCMGWD